MSRFLYSLWLISLAFFLLISGCSTPPPPEEPREPAWQPSEQDTRGIVEEAWRHDLYVFEKLEGEEGFEADGFEEAHEWLVEADDHLSEGSYSQAFILGTKSLSAFRTIVQRFTTTQLIPEMEGALVSIEKIVEEDADNPLKEFMPTLSSMLDNARQFDNEEQIDILDKIQQDLQEFRQLQVIIHDQDILKILGAVSFSAGKFELSEKGKDELEELAEEIVASINEKSQQFSDYTLFVTFKVVGYTDQQSFLPGTRLVKTLIKGFEEQFPDDRLEHRRFLNQRLSELRAAAASQYLQELIEANTQQVSNIEIRSEVIGFGEEIPPGFSLNYSAEHSIDDPRRRICKIYSYVIAR